MAPITLEIYGSIIFPKSATPFTSEAISIDITPPSPATPQKADTATQLATGPDNPLYRLPQLLSSSGLRVHLNSYAAPPSVSALKEAGDTVLRRSHTSSIDSEHILYEVTKTADGLVISNGRFEGTLSFTPGWFSGGVWTFTGKPESKRVDFKIDELGPEHGIWKMTYPIEKTVAREPPETNDVFEENHRQIEIEDAPDVQGWDPESWRDFITACWIAKVWQEVGFKGKGKSWFGASVRSEDDGAAGLRRY